MAYRELNSKEIKKRNLKNNLKLYLLQKSASFAGIDSSLFKITREYNKDTGKYFPLYQCMAVGCGKIFKKSSNIKAHMILHSGQKPF